MALWIAILFLLMLAIGIIIVLQKAQIEVVYWREGKEDLLTVVLRGPFGLAFYRAEMSLVDTSLWTKSGPAFRVLLARKDKLQGADKQVSPPLAVKDTRKLKHLVRKIVPLTRYRALLQSLARQARLEEFSWRMQFGTPDAALTGLCTGLAWALQAWLLAFLQNRAGWLIKPEAVDFVPAFDQTCFNTSFHCILSIRIVHVITAQLRWFKLKLRQRKR